LPPSSLLTQSSTDPKEALGVGGAQAGEQRYRAVIDVLDGMSVTDVAARNKVSRQTVHKWLRRYANGGMAALADKSSRPESCPHQMAPVIEARVVELRRSHPRWGPSVSPENTA
jgi:hypothetical protein